MGPLGFVNWRVLNSRFCVLMWMVAAVLAWVILTHLAPPIGGAAHHPMTHGALYGAGDR
jgi:hypothetical protein